MGSVKERVLALCESKGIKVGTLEKQTEMSNGTISKWTDETIPNGSTLQIIADFFGVSVDYLLGRENRDADIDSQLEMLHKNPKLRTLLSSGSKLNNQGIDAVLAIIDQMNKE